MFAACKFTHGEVPPDGKGSNTPPDGGMCTALTTECVGDTLRYCMEIGGSAMDIPCGWGCEAGSAAHCMHVVPSGSGGVEMNGVTPADVAGDMLMPATLVDGEMLDGDFGRIGLTNDANKHHGPAEGIENGIDFRFRGPISMWRFASLTINGTITLIGARPIALVSDGAVTINGIIDARSLCTTYFAGPGGYNGGSGSGSDGAEPPSTSGGGDGASAATTGGGGGAHGAAGGSGKAVAGGELYGDPEISVLRGGAGGGAGEGGGNFGRGGGGGGALQIVSNTKIDIVTGGINAGGCGGKPGTGNSDSGGGGGAGGTILLEAPIITINGVLAANGGGGGGGGGAAATAGSAGLLGVMVAPGGAGQATDEQGGKGGASGVAAEPGGVGANPGGGGGGIGRIRINTRGGSGAMITGATLSPGSTDSQFSSGSAKVR
jgi:hypothetical protein